MTYFAKSKDFLKFLKYIYVIVTTLMVVCMVEGMSYLMAPTKLVSVTQNFEYMVLHKTKPP
jgi:hypothetical protein